MEQTLQDVLPVAPAPAVRGESLPEQGVGLDITDPLVPEEEPYCAECGSPDELEEHHVVYRSNGGSDDPENIQVLCRECHVQLHRKSGDYEAWGRGGAAEVLRRRGDEGRAFLAEIGRQGGQTVRRRYGVEYLRRIGSRGGKSTVQRRGRGYMRKIGRRGGQATAARNGRHNDRI